MTEATLAASELLEVLWGRGQETARSAQVSPSQLRALLVIEDHEGTNLRALADALGSRPPAVSRLCDRLEAMGLAERCPSATSRREVELRLSLRGRAFLEEYRAARKSEVAAIVARMDPAQVADLASGLAAFHRAAAVHRAAEGSRTVPAGRTLGADSADTA
ncbi:MarR family transcriptional regulator [Kitasatospora aureofaciens]|uniref:MarR family transcriptional regulator n=1 Tax=Streptomyces rimosus subsp. rimosus (strain ATCC 10970 / DSM 40260 / JCM 4667 / NRRL 2234) TaxID=1265868 RepID=A0A8A1V0Q1_STRR1|nr:MarR family transcriptional regulator [Kitasatospora aureofaciens]KUJ39425.1 MarR family transcriptional regulator [Streptomyces rimosus subsp. rimosus]MYT44391.1 MarR family transcriptional regulator [Streptomyces sp. SID5471]QDA10138.1 MarR family transcriptional regulator [Streptomyces rimosus]QST85608.1 MarR family transcriptional regulator [Streptomyces rimosus subsp. rimosus ATCC 10970]RSO09097.1 MarR family transcriptional regulator [Streptomyces sp. WAC 06783]RSO27953.1 MarR family